MKIRYYLLSIALAGSALVSGCGEAPKEPAAERRSAAPVVTATYEAVAAAVEVPGTVQPRDRITLSAQINGFVRSVAVRAGDTVAAGQTLVTLDAREAESQKAMAQGAIDEAQAAREEARRGAEMAASARAAAKAADDLAASTLGRFEKLYEAKSVSQQEIDEARARRAGTAADLAARESMVAASKEKLRQVEARIAQARAQAGRADVVVGWTVLKAPSAGRVAERLADPGAAIFPGSPLLVIESVSTPQVSAELPTSHLGLLRRGLEVPVHIGTGTPPLAGRVAEIVPQSDPATHTVRFKVDLPAGAAPPSGAFARVGVPAGSRQALLVPARALRETGQLTGIFVLDAASKARFRLVKTAAFADERVEILSGLEPGERVVAAPTEEITDGTIVEIRQ